MKKTILFALAGLLGLVSCSRDGYELGRMEGSYAMDKMAGGGPMAAPNGGQGRPGGQAGVLTAGEWNDLDHWDFWSGLMASQDYGDMSAYWGMYTPRRVAVRVADATGKRLPAVRVVLEQKQRAVWSTLTDNQGEANLWIDPFHAQAGTDHLVLVVDGVPQASAPKLTPWNVQQEEAEVNFVILDKARPVEKRADIAFIVDATGSMGDEIEFLKKDLVNILDRVKSGQGEIGLRTGTVFYRDEEDDYLTKFSPFTEDYRKTIQYIAMQRASGGGDLPEAVHTALEAGLQNLAWNASARARIAFPGLRPRVRQARHQAHPRLLQQPLQGLRVHVPLLCRPHRRHLRLPHRRQWRRRRPHRTLRRQLPGRTPQRPPRKAHCEVYWIIF